MEASLRSGVPPTRLESGARETSISSFSWGAALAGAVVAAALALILLILGMGLGLTVVSPWANDGASGKAIGIGAIAWLVIVHLSSAALGGYLAGRLRTKWTDVHADEVFFRDTAHGLVAWAVGIIVSAVLLSSAAASIIGGATRAGAAVATSGAAVAVAGAAANEMGIDSNALSVDALLRSDRPREADDAAVRAEVGRIIARTLQQEDLTTEDRTYLISLVSARTGLSQSEVEKRLSDVMAQARTAEARVREAADEARKALIHISIWTFVALLIGAFAASYAATIGGRQRDNALSPVPF